MTPETLKHWRLSLRPDRVCPQREAADLLGYTLRHYQRLESGESPINDRTERLCDLVSREAV